MNLKINKLRLASAACIGALYGILSALTVLYEPVCSVAVSVIMVLVCFDIRNVPAFVKSLVLMYCVGMLFGGIMTFLQRIVYENRTLHIFSHGAGFALFAVMFAAILALVLLSARIFGMYIHKKSITCLICERDASRKVRLLLDTGNTLRDPYTGKAVIIVKAEILDGLLGSDGIHRSFAGCAEETALESKLYFISVKTVSGSALLPVIGSLKAFSLSGKGKKTELCAVVAADTSEKNDYSGNDGIIPYMLSGSF